MQNLLSGRPLLNPPIRCVYYCSMVCVYYCRTDTVCVCVLQDLAQQEYRSAKLQCQPILSNSCVIQVIYNYRNRRPVPISMWYTRVTSTNFVPQISTMVLILCTKVQKFEFFNENATVGPLATIGCGVMRGGICVRGLTRQNCHSLTLSFLQLDRVRTSPMPAPSRPHCILHAKFL